MTTRTPLGQFRVIWTRIFDGSVGLKLLEATPFENDIVLLRYERAGG